VVGSERVLALSWDETDSLEGLADIGGTWRSLLQSEACASFPFSLFQIKFGLMLFPTNFLAYALPNKNWPYALPNKCFGSFQLLRYKSNFSEGIGRKPMQCIH
jgi:hypothetical protein